MTHTLVSLKAQYIQTCKDADKAWDQAKAGLITSDELGAAVLMNDDFPYHIRNEIDENTAREFREWQVTHIRQMRDAQPHRVGEFDQSSNDS
jgi:hypothetical protein